MTLSRLLEYLFVPFALLCVLLILGTLQYLHPMLDVIAVPFSMLDLRYQYNLGNWLEGLIFLIVGLSLLPIAWLKHTSVPINTATRTAILLMAMLFAFFAIDEALQLHSYIGKSLLHINWRYIYFPIGAMSFAALFLMYKKVSLNLASSLREYLTGILRVLFILSIAPALFAVEAFGWKFRGNRLLFGSIEEILEVLFLLGMFSLNLHLLKKSRQLSENNI